ncbi:MAG: hypothetical protein ACLFUJ_16245 [Phycisphaerae bacterium]
MKRRTVALLGTMLLLSAASLADTIHLKDGRKYQGELVQKTTREVVFRVQMYGATMTKTFRPNEVDMIVEGPIVQPKQEAKPEPKKDGKPEVGVLPDPPAVPEIIGYDQPTYYLIPLDGEVGKTFLSRVLKESLADAAKRKPTVVILHVNSPGGSVEECLKLIKAIQEYSDQLRIAVYVKDAISAAAITSLAAPEIYMEPTATFGAAKAFRMGMTGIEDVDEKFSSVWRSKARSAADNAGHDPQLAEAMIDSSLELHWVEVDGKIEIKNGRGPNMVTRKGRLLTLTASEAKDCGLSKGTAKGLDELRVLMGIESWVECKGHGTLLAEYWTKNLKQFTKDMDELHEEYTEAMRGVEEWLPWRYQGYRLTRSGYFTAASRGIWRDRSNRCSRYLLQAEKIAQRASDLAKQIPEQTAYGEMIEDWTKELKNLRMKFLRNRNARGPRDITL